MLFCVVFFFKQKTAYEVRISDWSSDVCSSDLRGSRERLDRFLAVRRRVADVFAPLRLDAGETAAELGDDFRRVVHRQRRLGEVGELLRVGRADCARVVDRLDQRHGAGRYLAEGADDLRMPGMSDEENVTTLRDQAL